MNEPAIGDYVLATKYSDGDPGDGWAVGRLKSKDDRYGTTRYMVVDISGRQFRGNGFRRCEKITPETGAWLCKVLPMLDGDLMPPPGAINLWGLLGNFARPEEEEPDIDMDATDPGAQFDTSRDDAYPDSIG